MESQIASAETDQTLWDIDVILETLDVGPKPDKPEAIRQARLQRDAIIPHLIDAIESAVGAVENDSFPEGDIHFFSLFLLTEFKAKEALPAILEAVSLPDYGPYDIFGDAVASYLPITFSTLADDSFASVEQLILNRSVGEFVRDAAISSYLNFFHRSLLSREEVIDKLCRYLEVAISTDDWELGNGVVMEILTYVPVEALPTIEKVIELDLVDTGWIDLDFVHECIEEGEQYTQREIESRAHAEPPDTIEFLDSWYNVFRDPEPVRRRKRLPPAELSWDDEYDDEPEEKTIRNTSPKVGRNDPCTCGSGKKFKKCCGKV